MKISLLLASTALVLSSCCQDHTVQVLPSPTGKYEAVVRKEGCKYEDGHFQTVNVRRTASRPIPDGRCGEGANSITGFRMGNNQAIDMRWETDANLIVSVRGKSASAMRSRLVTCAFDRSVSIVFK